MAYIFMDFDDGVPRIAYTGCSRCSSVIGVSLCKIKNRGCCSYFQKFYPVELQRMSLSWEGLSVLESILKVPDVELYDEHIRVKGTFDEALHDKMLREGLITMDGNIHDTTIFFRTCPFVRSGRGCSLPPRYRAYVCNFFICREVLENPLYKNQLESYLIEREKYIRFLEWENNQLIQAMLKENLSIRKNLDDVLKFLSALPVNRYEYPSLSPVELPEDQGRGA